MARGRGRVSEKAEERMGLNVSLDTNIFIDVKNKDDFLEYSSKILDRIDSGS